MKTPKKTKRLSVTEQLKLAKQRCKDYENSVQSLDIKLRDKSNNFSALQKEFSTQGLAINTLRGDVEDLKSALTAKENLYDLLLEKHQVYKIQALESLDSKKRKIINQLNMIHELRESNDQEIGRVKKYQSEMETAKEFAASQDYEVTRYRTIIDSLEVIIRHSLITHGLDPKSLYNVDPDEVTNYLVNQGHADQLPEILFYYSLFTIITTRHFDMDLPMTDAMEYK